MSKCGRKMHVYSPDTISQVTQLINNGDSLRSVSSKLGITIHAVRNIGESLEHEFVVGRKRKNRSLEDIDSVLQLRFSGLTYRKIADDLNLTVYAVRSIILEHM